MGESFSRLTLDGTLPGPFVVPQQQAAAEAALLADQPVRMADIGAFLRRHFLLMTVVTGLSTIAGLAFVLTATPLYTASARVVVDPQRARVTATDTTGTNLEVGSAEIESQVVVMTSEPVVRSVVSELQLTDNPELRGEPSLLRRAIDALKRWVSSPPEPVLSDADVRLREAVQAVQSRLSAARVGQSYIIEVSYISEDPKMAAAVANAAASAFLSTGVRQKSEAVRVGAAWLDDRLVEIAEKANAAASAVEQFRRTHRIAPMTNEGGESLEERQLVQMNAERLQAKAAVATETASLAAIDKIIASGDLDGGYTQEALQSQSIARIRESLLAARASEAELSGRYGPDGVAVRARQGEIARLQGEIREELLRIRATHANSLDAAKVRAGLVDGDFRTAMTDNSAQDEARVGLAELESRARTYRTMYESALLQLTSATQKESFPLGDSRLVSDASVPLGKSSPKSGLVVAMAMVLGACFSVAVAGAREAFDRSVRSPERLQRNLGLTTLGKVPNAAPARRSRLPEMLRFWRPTAARLQRFALDEPYSSFTERMRSVKSGIDLGLSHRDRVVGITSTVRGEGKTTIAVNLAHMYAAEGFQTLLIHTDLRRSAATTPAAGGDGVAPFIARMSGELGDDARGDHAAARMSPDYLTLMKRVRERGRISAPLEVVTPDDLRTLWNADNRYERNVALCACIASARRQFDVVICDLPALENDADTELLASQHMDKVVLVLGKYRSVSLDRLAKAVFRNRQAKFPLLGVVFNMYRNA